MTKTEFRTLGVQVVDSINHTMRSAKPKNFTFEEEPDYQSGRLGGFYIAASSLNTTYCIQVFVNHDNPNYIAVTAVIPLPDDFMQMYPELNMANDELCGVKVTYSGEDFHALALICEIDTRNIENGNYGKFIFNGVSSIVENVTKIIKKQLLKGIIAAFQEM